MKKPVLSIDEAEPKKPLRADRPPTEVYRTFPQGYTPPFSFVHPVTGQPIVVTQPADAVARPQP